MKHQERTYRSILQPDGLVPFRVVVKETDLFVHADQPLEEVTRELILEYRGYIETYIQQYPEFATSLQPWQAGEPVPLIIKDMIWAGQQAGVGPMAAVAGAVAEHVGTGLLLHTEEIIVENGGDIFIKTKDPITIGIFAGSSPLSLRIGLRIDSGNKPFAACTSSGTVGHSLSLGTADAVSVVSDSCSLADAAATAIGNLIQSKNDIQQALDIGQRIEGVKGLVIIIGDAIGMWGDLEIVPLKGEKG